jgi:hypothetical protein
MSKCKFPDPQSSECLKDRLVLILVMWANFCYHNLCSFYLLSAFSIYACRIQACTSHVYWIATQSSPFSPSSSLKSSIPPSGTLSSRSSKPRDHESIGDTVVFASLFFITHGHLVQAALYTSLMFSTLRHRFLLHTLGVL